jgi:uncharacterized protein YbjT (DUF2867 family)
MYVITGATGNTGNAAAKHLLVQGQKVRVVGRSAERLRPLVAAGAEAFVADVTDAAALSQAFSGADGVYVMIPPNPIATDVLAYRNQVSDAATAAIQKTGVKHAVLLSSIGADKLDKTGPVVGLRVYEDKLNAVAGLNVVHLRAGDFMENLLGQIGVIRTMGIAAGPLRADVKLHMVATEDIGKYAADLLLKCDFKGKQARELQGQRDLTMAEAATILGKAIGKPDLQYLQAPNAQIRAAMVQGGMSENVADLMLEMTDALNSGHMRALEPRSAENTTPTSLEDFAVKVFAPAYKRTVA